MSSDVKFVRGVGFMVYEDYTSDDYEPIDDDYEPIDDDDEPIDDDDEPIDDDDDNVQDLSNYEWCSLAECYVDKEDCTNRGCENCSYYLNS